jgi:hypothetical protein
MTEQRAPEHGKNSLRLAFLIGIVLALALMSLAFEPGPEYLYLNTHNTLNFPITVYAYPIGFESKTTNAVIQSKDSAQLPIYNLSRAIGCASSNKPYHIYAVDPSGNRVYDHNFTLTQIRDMKWVLWIEPQ